MLVVFLKESIKTVCDFIRDHIFTELLSKSGFAVSVDDSIDVPCYLIGEYRVEFDCHQRTSVNMLNAL